MSHNPFSSPQTLAAAFQGGLERLLEEPQLGAFILVLANATYDPVIMARCERRLYERFAEFADSVRDQLAAGREPDFAPDDLQVFLKLMALGLERLPPREVRNEGDWVVQFNLLRAFRPQRASGEVIRELVRPFNAQAFHFNKPFLRKEIFWAGELSGRRVALLYNKYPFARYHGLLVPDGAMELAQYLSADDHAFVWRLCAELGNSLPGVGLGYNALGGGASINHLHFQFYVDEQPLPVELEQWRHNGGERDYPLVCSRFTDQEAAWKAIARCHTEGRPYNLLYRPEGCYLLERGWQGVVELPLWMSAVTWFEAAGAITCFNRDDYQGLGSAQIMQALGLQGT